MIEDFLGNFALNEEKFYTSLPYFIALAYIGCFLVLKRASLFGLVLADCTKVAYALGISIHALGDEDIFDLVNKSSATELTSALNELDVLIIPLTLILILAVTLLGYFVTKRIKNKEAFFAILIVVLTASVRFIHSAFSHGEKVLGKAYFTPLLYTPDPLFYRYLIPIGILVIVILIFSRRFLLIAFDEVQAKVLGIKTPAYDILFYLLTGLIIAFSVQVIGLFETMAALLIPAFLSVALTRTTNFLFAFVTYFGLLFSATGLFISFVLGDLESGPAIIMTYALFSTSIWGFSSLTNFCLRKGLDHLPVVATNIAVIAFLVVLCDMILHFIDVKDLSTIRYVVATFLSLALLNSYLLRFAKERGQAYSSSNSSS